MKLTSILTAAAIACITSTALAAPSHADEQGEQGQIGKPGVAANAKRTIKVDMRDTMRFIPESITVKQGETVKFIVKNSGKINHEMVLGTEKELKQHYEAMKKNPEMEHADDNKVTVQPGKSGAIIWQFTKAGKVNFACLEPGHYDAGMKGSVTVGGLAK